jgi:hypothetical protein
LCQGLQAASCTLHPQFRSGQAQIRMTSYSSHGIGASLTSSPKKFGPACFVSVVAIQITAVCTKVTRPTIVILGRKAVIFRRILAVRVLASCIRVNPKTLGTHDEWAGKKHNREKEKPLHIWRGGTSQVKMMMIGIKILNVDFCAHAWLCWAPPEVESRTYWLY